MEASSLTDEELGAFLRERGLHEVHLKDRRETVLDSLRQHPQAKKGEKNRIRNLERELRRKDKALAETAALLVLQKNVKAIWGTSEDEDENTALENDESMSLIQEARANGVRLSMAAESIGLSSRTHQRWVHCEGADDGRRGPSTPANRLSEQERARVLEIANSPEYRDLSPNQIVPLLAQDGLYVASESTFYRVLRKENQLHHRQRARLAKRHKPKERIANGPCQVWSWDITYLRTNVRGHFFFLYVMMDVWSRKIVGWTISDVESSVTAALMVARACSDESVKAGDVVLHSDNGSPMKGASLLSTMQELGVAASFSRPSVSNDNPFSEALFRTLKYRPDYPHRPFETLAQATAWVTTFVDWYNGCHLHSSLNFVTPHQRHSGEEAAILEQRNQLYLEARKRKPLRWSEQIRNCDPAGNVYLNPAKRTHMAEQHEGQAA